MHVSWTDWGHLISPLPMKVLASLSLCADRDQRLLAGIDFKTAK